VTEAVSFDALARGEPAAIMRLSQAAREQRVCYLDGGDLLGCTFQSKLFSVATEFFRLPSDVKRKVDMAKSGNLRGYVGFGQEHTNGIEDLKESFEFAQDRSPPKDLEFRPYHRLYGPNLWPPPSVVPEFEATLRRYNDAMDRIGEVVLEALAAALRGLDDEPSCGALLRKRPCHFSRLIYYSHPSSFAPSAARLVAHTDHAFLALALQSAPGFEFCDASGTWELADPPACAVTVFAGELADFWSSGHYPACPHRVRNATLQTERYSVTTFFLPDLDAVVRPIGADGKFGRPAVVGEQEWARMQAIFRIGNDGAV
jgi:isopenicillin N synthase-like dioxygenase